MGRKYRRGYPISASRQRLKPSRIAFLKTRDACERAKATDHRVTADIHAERATISKQAPERPPSVIPDPTSLRLWQSHAVRAARRLRRTNLPLQNRTHGRRLERRTAGALASEASPSRRPSIRSNAVPCCVMRCWTSGVPATAPIQ